MADPPPSLLFIYCHIWQDPPRIICLVNGGNQQQQRPWSAVVSGAQTHQTRGRQQQRNGGVSTRNHFDTLQVLHKSTSKKRKQEDVSALEVGTDQNGANQLKPKPKNRSPPQCGTGASGGKLAANYEMYVSRTHPDTSKEYIRGLVKENS